MEGNGQKANKAWVDQSPNKKLQKSIYKYDTITQVLSIYH